MPITQIHSRAEETLEFKVTQPRETFHFNLPISIERYRMLGLTCVQIYNSVFDITEKNIKIELDRNTFDEFS